MKNKRTIVLVVAITVAIAIMIGLYVAGFRITYNPDLITDWDAVSGCAAWAGILTSSLLSIAAIIYAIRVPKEIANRQDKIALFEKRIDCYNAVQSLIACANQLSSVTTNKAVQTAFRLWLDLKYNITEDIPFSDFVVQLNQMKPVLISGDFLFEKYDQKLLQNIINTGIDLTTQVASTNENESKSPLSENAMRTKDEFCRLCTEFSTEYIDSMENELNLKN